jgi:membrane protease YdiL (CAAX protease family)
MSYQHPPPPSRPELPEGAVPTAPPAEPAAGVAAAVAGDDRPAPRWPWWYSVAGLATAMGAGLFATLLVGLVVGAIVGPAALDTENPPGGLTVAAGLVLQATFIGAALLFASFTARPRAWHFGLKRARFWPALGWTALGMVAFFVFVGIYGALVQPDAEQTIIEDLGVRDSMALLILGSVMAVVVAPIGEELFFRGFFYGSLRGTVGVLPAALITGVVFGIFHLDPSQLLQSLEFVPVLAFLGFVFCLIYQLSGTLYSVIAVHSLNNVVAFGTEVGGDAWIVGGALGVLTVVACVLLPRFSDRRPAAPAPAPA